MPGLGEEGQLKLLSSKVLVIGAGGLGCPALSYLAAAGIGTIGILDYDIIDKSNLHRQILFDESQIGFSKAEASAVKLRSLNSEIKFKFYNNYLTLENGFEIIKDYDVIIDSTDNFKSKYLVNDLCVILNKPFIMGAINKFEGQVAVLNYDGGPTYRCIYPVQISSNMILNCEESGVIGALAGMVGTIQAMETIKLITGIGESLSGEILFINSLNMEFRKIKVKRNQNSVEQALKLKENFLLEKI